MCFFNSETGFLHISQIRFVGFGLGFDPLCFFEWLLLMKIWVQMLQGTFSGLWIFLWWDKVPWLLKDFEHTVHLYDFTPEWIKRWDDIVFLLYNLQHTRCIWPFLPSAGESFAYDISTSPSYWKPLNICHMAFCQDRDSLVAIIMIIEGHLAEITLFCLCEWFDAVPAVCRLQHCENKCHIWVDYHEHKHGNRSGSEIWKSFCKGSMSLLVLCERG